MAERVLMSRSVMVGGFPLKREIIELTPPQIKKKYASSNGGSFGTRSVLVGVEPMSGASIKINDLSIGLAATYGFVMGEKVTVTILDSYQDSNGIQSVEQQIWYGEIADMPDEGSKQTGTDSAMQSVSINFADLISATKLLNGKTIHKINLDTDEVDFGQGDVLQKHRVATGRS